MKISPGLASPPSSSQKKGGSGKTPRRAPCFAFGIPTPAARSRPWPAGPFRLGSALTGGISSKSGCRLRVRCLSLTRPRFAPVIRRCDPADGFHPSAAAHAALGSALAREVQAIGWQADQPFDKGFPMTDLRFAPPVRQRSAGLNAVLAAASRRQVADVLGGKSGLSAQTVSGIVRSMEKEGLIASGAAQKGHRRSRCR